MFKLICLLPSRKDVELLISWTLLLWWARTSPMSFVRLNEAPRTIFQTTFRESLSLPYETGTERITDSCLDYNHRHSQRCWLDWIQENVQRSSSNECWFLWSFSIEQKRAKEMRSQTFWREGAGLLLKLDSIQLTSLLNSSLFGMNSSEAAHNPWPTLKTVAPALSTVRLLTWVRLNSMAHYASCQFFIHTHWTRRNFPFPFLIIELSS